MDLSSVDAATLFPRIRDRIYGLPLTSNGICTWYARCAVEQPELG